MKPRREISSAGEMMERELLYSWILEVPAPSVGSLWMEREEREEREGLLVSF